MGDIDVEAIKARAEAVSDDWCGYTDSVGENAGRCELFAGPMIDGYRDRSVFAVREDCDCGCFPPSPDEMRFIECVRQDVPDLLAEVTRLRSVVAGVEALADDENDDIADDLEIALENAHGASHYDCCFNAVHLAWPSANAVKRRLRSVLSDTRQEEAR